jgi:hypothetical protein
MATSAVVLSEKRLIGTGPGWETGAGRKWYGAAARASGCASAEVAEGPDSLKIQRKNSGSVPISHRAPQATDRQSVFPYGPFDDQMDALSQYLAWIVHPAVTPVPGRYRD